MVLVYLRTVGGFRLPPATLQRSNSGRTTIGSTRDSGQSELEGFAIGREMNLRSVAKAEALSGQRPVVGHGQRSTRAGGTAIVHGVRPRQVQLGSLGAQGEIRGLRTEFSCCELGEASPCAAFHAGDALSIQRPLQPEFIGRTGRPSAFCAAGATAATARVKNCDNNQQRNSQEQLLSHSRLPFRPVMIAQFA